MTHKELARELGRALAEKGVNIPHSNLLHVVAALHGLPNWQTLSARQDTPMLGQEAVERILHERLLALGVSAEVAEKVVQGDPTKLGSMGSTASRAGSGNVVDTSSEIAGDGIELQAPPQGRSLTIIDTINEIADRTPSHPTLSDSYIVGSAGRGKGFASSALESLKSDEQRGSSVVGEPIFKFAMQYLDKRLAILSGPEHKSALTQSPATTEAANIRKGQRVSIYPDGSNSFVVQEVLKGFGGITLITEQGVPVDLGEFDPVYVVTE